MASGPLAWCQGCRTKSKLFSVAPKIPQDAALCSISLWPLLSPWRISRLQKSICRDLSSEEKKELGEGAAGIHVLLPECKCFSMEYRCISMSMVMGTSDRSNVEKGRKIMMPTLAFDQLS
ncbi:hypothetical protein QTO34_019271 [Cnephaeus nilssonii]|uniref:Uncharacterized protein n=1 Tax=Cnephaeus nilssonii TaxID=3371016 RepID=A0AA40HWL3_CNENI|nr:hypothetical protein QTO34_019271 [Eptesicus nilssonii]